MRISLARFVSVLPIVVSALFVLAPAASAVEGEFSAPGASEVVSSFITVTAGVGPVSATGGEFRTAGAALAGCSAGTPGIFVSTPTNGFAHGLSCTWNTTTVLDGPHVLQLWGNDGGLQHVASADRMVTVDNTNPGAPMAVIDDRVPATGSDIDVAGTGSVGAGWVPGMDANLVEQQVCVTTINSSCATAIRTDIVGASATTATLTGAPLMSGPTYFTCVRGVDAAQNEGPYACSDGFTVDDTNPTAPSGVVDDADPATGADVDLLLNGGNTIIRWTGGTDASGVQGYDWCISTVNNCSEAVRAGTSGASPATTTAPALADGTYYSCVRTRDNVGNTSGPHTCSDGFVVDAAAPSVAGSVAQSVDAAAGAATITWSAATDAGSGVKNYDWCFSTTASCAGALRSGTVTGTSASSTGAALAAGTYYACVTARDNVDRSSATACSAPFTYAPVPPTPAEPTAPALTVSNRPVDCGVTRRFTSTLSGASAPAGLAGYSYVLRTVGETTVPDASVELASTASTIDLVRPAGAKYELLVSSVDTLGRVSAPATASYPTARPLVGKPVLTFVTPKTVQQGTKPVLKVRWSSPRACKGAKTKFTITIKGTKVSFSKTVSVPLNATVAISTQTFKNDGTYKVQAKLEDTATTADLKVSRSFTVK